uniref:CUB domain-containing protein n=1 Tax=Periophthalmus magnuspinnatus TaxID=409849 RepID=A0A3B4B111_9GOBI
GEQLAKFCGQTIPPSLKTLAHVFVFSGCGANFTASRGNVVSPNYPSDYPHRANCNYTINAGEQSVVVLTFRVFQLEGTPSTQLLQYKSHCDIHQY